MGQVVVDQPEAGRAVVVVGVDDSERRVERFGRCKHRVGRAPGLDAAFGNREPGRQLVQRLVGVAHGEPGLFGACADALTESRVDLRLDDKDDGLKTGAARVKQAVIQNCLAVRPHRVNLLQPAVAAAHAGRHHGQDRFVHAKNSLSLKTLRFAVSIVHRPPPAGKRQREGMEESPKL